MNLVINVCILRFIRKILDGSQATKYIFVWMNEGIWIMVLVLYVNVSLFLSFGPIYHLRVR